MKKFILTDCHPDRDHLPGSPASMNGSNLSMTVIPEVVSFSADIQPIFNEGCNNAGCHATGGIAPDLTPANAYADLFAKNLIDLVNP